MSSSSSKTHADMRNEAVEAVLSTTRNALAGGVTRETLDIARRALDALATDTALWTEADFPAPQGEERQARYMIAQDDPEGLTLYLNVMRPGKIIPPHDHTTWACVAGVEGIEHNGIWDRLDDGSETGKAQLQRRELIALGSAESRSIALMPDDIHSVEIRGDDIIRHLHMYGRPLETLSNRTVYDPDAGTCRPMTVGVTTRR